MRVKRVKQVKQVNQVKWVKWVEPVVAEKYVATYSHGGRTKSAAPRQRRL